VIALHLAGPRIAGVDRGALIALASYMHALRVRPRLLETQRPLARDLERRHWELLGVEPMLGVGVVIAAGLLVAFTPPRELRARRPPAVAAGPALPAAGPFNARASPGQLSVAEEDGSLLDDDSRATFEELLGLSRTVFPYVEEHKFYCDYWFLTRWWNKVREFGALLAEHRFLEDAEDIFQLGRHEVATALDELVLTWATGGEALGPKHWPPIAARRRQLLEKLGDWSPPPALGVTPEAVTDPMTIMLWGVTTQRVQEWARQRDGGAELTGAPASPGEIEGPARVVRTVDEIGDIRDGEILVCSITSPAWAPIFSKITATASTGCRRWSGPAPRPRGSAPASSCGSTARPAW